MTSLTRDDVVAVLGRVDDGTITRLIGTGASRQDLTEAAAWLTNDELLVKAGRPMANGGVGRLVEILATLQDDEDALLESSSR